MDAGWAIYGFIVGWVFAPAFWLILLLPVAVWRWVFPPKPMPNFFQYNDPPPPLPKPPLTDAEYHRLMVRARLMRRRLQHE